MSKLGAKAASRREEPQGEPLVYVLVIEKRNGGFVVSKGRAPLSAVRIEASHPPDALDMAIGWGTSRLEEDIQRGKL